MSIRTSSRLVSQSTAEPVALQELKDWAKIDSNADDAMLNNLITTARESAERFLRRAIVSQTRTLTLDLPQNGWARNLPDGTYELPVTCLYGELSRTIDLPYGDVRSITSVQAYDIANNVSTYASSNYILDTASSRLVLNYSASWPSNLREKASIVITYVTGYASAVDVPRSIKTAILMHAAHMYDSRIICEMPDACTNLLQQHRKYGENML